LLNHQSGLAGLSNGESDMRALTAAAEKGDAPSILAIDIFTRAIARTIGSYIVSLQGLDTLIFTGGIGENSHPVREKVCNQLLPLAIYIDKEKNRENADVISTSDSSAEIRVIPTDEDGQIARHTRAMLLSSATLNVQAPTPAVATR
jgi:acetate kinase